MRKDNLILILASLKTIMLFLNRLDEDIKAIKRQLYNICAEKDIAIEPEIMAEIFGKEDKQLSEKK